VIVYSNKAAREEYVELRLDDRVALRHRGRNIVGIAVSALVFSSAARYDGLVDFNRNHLPEERAAAMALLRSMAAQHGLTEDVGLAHRRRIWSV
jgi:hypothetical protein